MECPQTWQPQRRIWRKTHIGIDKETLEVRAVELTTSYIGNAPMLPELLKLRRDLDALCETTGSESHGAGLRPAGRGDPNPHRRAKPLHSSWDTSDKAFGISPAQERGRTFFTRFVQ